MNGHDPILGIVQDGQFRRVGPGSAGGGPTRLTTMSMQAAALPEGSEIPLAEYEGFAIMVQGHDGGGWIYSANVIEKAGAILTAVVRRVFAAESQATPSRGPRY